MTMRSIEDKYKVMEEELDEMLEIAGELEDVITGKDALLAISAMSMLIVEAVHQMNMTEDRRVELIRSSLTAAWTDHHSSPDGQEIH